MATRLMDGQIPDPAAPVATGCVDAGRKFNELDQAAAIFVSARPRLFGIAYRILGTANEAEDVVQEVWFRWHGTDRTIVINPLPFLMVTTTRLALNHAQYARRRHEICVGPRVPEPVDTSGPETWAEQGEAIELAVLLLLEKLTPAERAAYVLREAFGYPYRQISQILQRGEANTRQVVKRARDHIAAERRAPVSQELHRRLVRAFRAAAQDGELTALEGLLAEDAVA